MVSKRLMTSMFVLLLLPVLVFAQTHFTLEPVETEITIQEAAYTEFHFTLTNTSDEGLTFNLELENLDFPGEGWRTMVCTASNCISGVFATDELAAGASDGDVHVSIIPNSEGVGRLTFKVYPSNYTDDVVETQLVLTVGDVDVAGETAAEITDFELMPVYPNPFNAMSTVRFSLPQASDVRIAAYTVTGRLVETLVNEHLTAGTHQSVFVGRENMASGTYIIRMDVPSQKSMITRAVLIK